MNKLLSTAVFAALSFGVAESAYAGTTVFSGTITGDPDYHRPSYTNNYTPAFNCSDCGFSAELISVTQAGIYTFSVLSSSFDDIVGILYQGAFDPTAPMTNYVGPLSRALYNGSGFVPANISLAANTQYTWVTSTDFGVASNQCGTTACTFTTRVSGPGEITATAAVPEVSTWAMMIVGFGGLGAVLRSRRRLAAAQA